MSGRPVRPGQHRSGRVCGNRRPCDCGLSRQRPNAGWRALRPSPTCPQGTPPHPVERRAANASPMPETMRRSGSTGWRSCPPSASVVMLPARPQPSATYPSDCWRYNSHCATLIVAATSNAEVSASGWPTARLLGWFVTLAQVGAARTSAAFRGCCAPYSLARLWERRLPRSARLR